METVVRRWQAAVLPHCRTTYGVLVPTMARSARPLRGHEHLQRSAATESFVTQYPETDISEVLDRTTSHTEALPRYGSGCTCTVGNQVMSSLETPTSFLGLCRKDMDISSFMTWYMVYGMYISSSRLDNHINWETIH